MKKPAHPLRLLAAVTAVILAVTMVYHQYIPRSFEDISGLDGTVRRDNVAHIHMQWGDARLYTTDAEELSRISRAVLDYLNDFTYQYDPDFDFQTVFPDGLEDAFPQVYLTYRHQENRSALLLLMPLDGTHIQIGYRYYTVLNGPLDPEIFNACLEREHLEPVTEAAFE